MLTAKILKNGKIQAVRLPKECMFNDNEVNMKKIGSLVILYPRGKEWEIFLEDVKGLSEDFNVERLNDFPVDRLSL